MLKLSIIIPAYNEEDSLPKTLNSIYTTLDKYDIPHEILVINDNSTDNTLQVLQKCAEYIPSLIYYTNPGPNGFGCAIIYGLDRFKGDCVTIMMADLADSPEDLVRFYYKLQEEKYDCVFGSRFIKGSQVIDYPKLKLLLNRIGNYTLCLLFGYRYNDTTNPFKLYRQAVIQEIKPFVSRHFSLEIEIPLKAITRGYSYTILPNDWRNREMGESKMKIFKLGSRYLFIIIYCLAERLLANSDYHKKNQKYRQAK